MWPPICREPRASTWSALRAAQARAILLCRLFAPCPIGDVFLRNGGRSPPDVAMSASAVNRQTQSNRSESRCSATIMARETLPSAMRAGNLIGPRNHPTNPKDSALRLAIAVANTNTMCPGELGGTPGAESNNSGASRIRKGMKNAAEATFIVSSAVSRNGALAIPAATIVLGAMGSVIAPSTPV